MRRLFLLLTLCLTLLATPFSAQDEPVALNYMYTHNVTPIARLGWGVPNAAVYMPDGEIVAIATGAGITFYDQMLVERQHIPTWSHSPRVIAISPDGSMLATGGDDVRLWDVESGALLDILPSGIDVSALDFSSDGTLLVVSHGILSHEGKSGIFIFETATGREQKHFLPGGFFTHVSFDPTGRFVIATLRGSVDSVVIELATGESLNISIPSEFVQITPDGKTVVGFDRSWSRFDLNSPDDTYMSSVEDVLNGRFVTAVTPISPDGIFASLMDSGEFSVWNVDDLTRRRTFSLGFRPDIAAINHTATKLVAVDQQATRLVLIDAETGNIETEAAFLNVAAGPIAAFGVGYHVFFTTSVNQVGWWDITNDEYGVMDGHEAKINALITDIGYGYSASDDGTIRRWNSYSNPSTSEILFDQPSSQVKALTPLKSGELLAVVCEGGHGQLLRLDTQTGESLGFIGSGETGEAIHPAFDLPSCDVALGTTLNGIVYADYEHIYRFDGMHISFIQRSPIRLRGVVPLVTGGRVVLLGQGAVLDAAPFAYSSPADYPTIIATHAQDVTAFAPVDASQFLYASAACAGYEEAFGGDMICYGADMALTSWEGRRATLEGHSEIVKTILMLPNVSAFISVSEDGTIILWGAPLDPQPLRRIGGLD
jgi:WD40 repeat protein